MFEHILWRGGRLGLLRIRIFGRRCSLRDVGYSFFQSVILAGSSSWIQTYVRRHITPSRKSTVTYQGRTEKPAGDMDILDYAIGLGELTIRDFQMITHIFILATSGVALFGVGCRLRITDLENREKGLALGLFLHALVVPFLTFLICICIRLEGLEALPILLTSSAPIAGYTSVLTLWANGDHGLGVLLSVLSSCLSVGFLPLTHYLFSSYWQNDFFLVAGPLSVMIYILAIIIPVGAGMGFRHFFPKASIPISKISTGAYLIRFIGVFIFTGVYYPQQFLIDWHAWIVIFLAPLTGFMLGWLAGRQFNLPQKTTVAISLAMGATNTNMVVSSGLDVIKDPVQLQILVMVPVVHFIVTPLLGLVCAGIHRYMGRNKYPTLFGNTKDLVDVVI